MKLLNLKKRSARKTLAQDWRAIFILVAGFILTAAITLFTNTIVENQDKEEFVSVCHEIEIKINTRLQAHILILRAGTALFAVSDTVTRNEWKEFIDRSKIHETLPGIQGVGFSMVVPEKQLDKHIDRIQKEGFPDYTIYPPGKREVYTSIIYLEPFSGRNLRAFGFDMFSEATRRKAMELSRDSNMAMLSGKVDLVQETGEDVQAGTLMYVPVYENDKPVNTLEQRRAAIRGWVYSPYRMADLMEGILGRWEETDQYRIHLKVYDDNISESSILYDSQKALDNKPRKRLRTLMLPVDFNGKKWILLFTQSREFSFIKGTVLIVLISGVIISVLLFIMALMFFKTVGRLQKIDQQNEELQKINASKDKFFSIIAHDLKSPFNAIVGFSSVLVDQVKAKNYEGIERFAEIINQSSAKAMNLLMNLMEWSQSQTGRIEFNPEYFDMIELIKEVEYLLIDVAKQKLIELKNELPLHAKAWGDSAMINTVLRNLISNAIKYTEFGGTIILSVETNPEGINVSVADTGVGIPKNRIGNLFRIDESFSTSGTQDEKGTGLGLILCKEFIDNHKGKIWVDSQPGKGSTFHFWLPAKSEYQ